MQLTDYKGSNLEGSSPIQSSSAFAFEDSPVAFMLMSDGLYKDGIRAAIREIACNARDAHTMVGKDDVPIEVKLPNAIDPVFYVRDFGPGLGTKAMETVYNVYFKSTKSSDNRQTGGFGLGAKSPFAYTDNFMVVSRHEGEQFTYTAYKDDEGFPRFARIATEPCSPEDSGITVSFPVKPEDFSRFQEIAIDVLREFDVLPNLLGATVEFEAPPVAVTVGKTLSVRKTGTVHGLYLRMANVVYPVLLDKLALDFTNEERGWLQILQAKRAIVGEVPAGSFVPLPSREDVKYNGNLYRTVRTALIEAPLAEVKRIYDEAVARLGMVDLEALRQMRNILVRGLHMERQATLSDKGTNVPVAMSAWIASKLGVTETVVDEILGGLKPLEDLPGGELFVFREGLDVRVDMLSLDGDLKSGVRRRALQRGMHYTTKKNHVGLPLDDSFVLVVNDSSDARIAGRTAASLAAREWSEQVIVVTRGKQMSDEQFAERIKQIRDFLSLPEQWDVSDERIGLAEFSLAVDDEDEAEGAQTVKKERAARRTMDERRLQASAPVLDLDTGRVAPRSVGDMANMPAGVVLWHPRESFRNGYVTLPAVAGCISPEMLSTLISAVRELDRLMKAKTVDRARYVVFPLQSEITSLALADEGAFPTLKSYLDARLAVAEAHRAAARASAAVTLIAGRTGGNQWQIGFDNLAYALMARSQTADEARELFGLASAEEQQAAERLIEAIFEARGTWTRDELDQLSRLHREVFESRRPEGLETLEDWVTRTLMGKAPEASIWKLARQLQGSVISPANDKTARALFKLSKADVTALVGALDGLKQQEDTQQLRLAA